MNETLNEKSISQHQQELEQALKEATGSGPWTKRPVPLLLGLLLLWIVAGAYITYLFCCSPKAAMSNATNWTVKDGSTLVAKGNDNVKFTLAGSTPILSEKTVKEYGDISTYLNENQGKILKVHATYAKDEKNTTDYENLGLARAALLKEKLIALGFPKERILTSASLTDSPVHAKDTVYGAAELDIKTLGEWAVKDDSELIAEGDEGVKFAFAGSQPIVSEATAKQYGPILTYLNRNKYKVLNVHATYTKDEKKPRDYENLGLARAELLKEKLIALGFPKEQILTSASMIDSPIRVKDVVYSAANLDITTIKDLYLSFNEGDFNTEANDNLKFTKGKATFDKPVSSSVQSVLGSLADHLRDNPKKNIQLTGWYGESEENKTEFENLGLARANEIKKLLVSLGAPADQIKLKGKLRDDLVFVNNKLYGGAAYEFLDDAGNPTTTDDEETADKTDAEKEEGDEKTSEETDASEKPDEKPKAPAPPKVLLYFATNRADGAINPTVKAKMEKVLKYAKENMKTTLLVDGHTDNRGSIKLNSELSKRRANFAKDYLVKNGLEASRIKIRFLGADNPIVDNNTEANRAKNRRVEVYME